MTPHVLLEKLRLLLQTIPPLEGRGRYENEQYKWLGQVKAALYEWDQLHRISFDHAVKNLIDNFRRPENYGVVISFLHEVIARLENSLPQDEGQAFGPGAVYDFFRALNDIVSSAQTQCWVVDPYLDAEIFDGYLRSLRPSVSARLLTIKHLENVSVAAKKYQAQSGSQVDIRSSQDIHDRIVFVDNNQCWVLGASIKDAALRKPTYLAPLSPDVAAEKLKHYETIWNAGKTI